MGCGTHPDLCYSPWPHSRTPQPTNTTPYCNAGDQRQALRAQVSQQLPWEPQAHGVASPLEGLKQKPRADSLFIFSWVFCFFLFFIFVVFCFCFNLCKHDGDEECLARLSQTRLWFWAVNVKHTLGQTTRDECSLSSPRPPLSMWPKKRLLRENKT